MLKSLWRWAQRDRTFALLAGGIVVMGLILFGLVVVWYNPPVSRPAPASNPKITNAPGVAAPIKATPEPQYSPTSKPTYSFTSATPVIGRPDPTQIANLPNQGQNPAPPPPNLFAQSQTTKATTPSPTSSTPTLKPTSSPIAKA